MAPRGGRAAVNIGADSDEEEPDTGPASVVNNGGAGSGPANRSCVPAPPLSSAGSPVISADGKSIEPERSSRWAELLRDRPPTGDSNAMSSWLLEVLSVSLASQKLWKMVDGRACLTEKDERVGPESAIENDYEPG